MVDMTDTHGSIALSLSLIINHFNNHEFYCEKYCIYNIIEFEHLKSKNSRVSANIYLSSLDVLWVLDAEFLYKFQTLAT